MKVTVTNVRPFSEGKLGKMANITVDEDGIISAIGDQVEGTVIDGDRKICAAGYIDIHTHGGWGKDCMEPTRDAIETIAHYHLHNGITTFCPTTMTAAPEDINAAAENIWRFHQSNDSYARIFGIHLEGPYLSQKSAGAHPPQYLLAPTRDNRAFVKHNLDMVARITLAPNLRDAADFCAWADSRGIQISLGHDNSIDDEIYACLEAGASSVTHLYNCTSRPSRRDNPKKHLGLTEIALVEDQLICEVIADNRHVPDKLFDMIFRLKGAQGICLVSDSLSVAGKPAGDYYLGSGKARQSIRVEDGVAVLPSENTYAGSVTPVSKMVAMLKARGYSISDALTMATLTPAKLLHMNDRGDLRVGMLGDFNILDKNLRVVKTFLGGKEYKRTACAK